MMWQKVNYPPKLSWVYRRQDVFAFIFQEFSGTNSWGTVVASSYQGEEWWQAHWDLRVR